MCTEGHWFTWCRTCHQSHPGQELCSCCRISLRTRLSRKQGMLTSCRPTPGQWTRWRLATLGTWLRSSWCLPGLQWGSGTKCVPLVHPSTSTPRLPWSQSRLERHTTISITARSSYVQPLRLRYSPVANIGSNSMTHRRLMSSGSLS